MAKVLYSWTPEDSEIEVDKILERDEYDYADEESHSLTEEEDVKMMMELVRAPLMNENTC